MMNRVFDHNGTIVAPSKPVKQLTTVKKTILIDSGDRDVTKYTTNGDVVYFLPRVYEGVLSMRLKSATFPRLVSESSSAGARVHTYATGSNQSSSVSFASDTTVPVSNYIVVDIEGLNKVDETTIGAQRSTYPDSFFARIPAALKQHTSTGYFIEYNDNVFEQNVSTFSPPVGKLDRLHIRTRLHSQQDTSGFIYWTSNGAVADGSVERAVSSQYSLVFELEMIDNSFDAFSSFETRLSDRS